jgi:hypothetical protein
VEAWPGCVRLDHFVDSGPVPKLTVPNRHHTAQLTFPQPFMAMLRSYNFTSLGHWSGQIFSKGGIFMTEQKDRVFARMGARTLTQAELAEVSCGFATAMIITDLLTNFGRDFSVDHLEN